MALAVCLLFDPKSDDALRSLCQRLEAAGVPTLLSHTHGRHVPHLSYVVLLDWDLDRVRSAVDGLPDGGATTFHLDALGTFRRGRSWLVPAVTGALAMRQEAVVTAVSTTGADLHRNYRPGRWVPHVTIAPRVRLESLQTLAAQVYDVLPMSLVADRAALIDSGTGQRWTLEHVP